MMLQLPRVGFAPSVEKHNVDRDVLCDWIEASLLFVDEKISATDVKDILIENDIYESQDMASEIVTDAWSHIERRQGWLGKSRLMKVKPKRLERLNDWMEVPAHGFCLALTMRKLFPDWSDAIGAHYIEQGELFELLTLESLTTLGWKVHRTGWAGVKGVTDFQTSIIQIADEICEITGSPLLAEDDAKDLGLDLVCHRPFVDGRGGWPVFLVQCASGIGWENKLRTPSLATWGDLVRFTSPHQRAFAMPFALVDDKGFRSTRLKAEGLFLDRYRILSAGFKERSWVSAPLRDRIIAWLDPRVSLLPTG